MSLFVISSSGYAQAAITITNGPNVDQGTTYNNFTFFGASGGVAPYTYSVSNFGGPGGTNWTSGSFVFNSNGTLSGLTCQNNGNATYDVTVRDSTGATATFNRLATQVNRAPSGSCQAGALTVTSATPTGTTVGGNYSQTTTTTGGTGPYTYSISSGSLPPGTTLNAATGTVSGTPTTPGTYTYTITSTDSLGNTGTTTVTTTITASTLSITPNTTTPTGTVGTAYSQTNTAAGGSGTKTYSLASGTLPPGTTLNTATGAVSGTPTTAGTYTYAVKVTDSSGNATTSNITATIGNAGAVTLGPTSGALTAGTQGTAYTQTFTSSGGTGSYTYSSSGTLPSGTSLNTSTGVLSGTPTTPGTYSFSITTTDTTTGTPLTATNNYTIVVNAATAPTITPDTTSPTGTVSVPYTQTNTGAGGYGTLTYSLASGTLPPGTTLNPATGTVSGTPTTSGTYTYAIKVTDANGSTATTSNIVATIGATGTVGLGPTTVPDATQGAAYSQTFTTTGGTGPYTYTSSGTLPPGLTLTNGGVLSGTPTAPGTYSFTVTTTDANGLTDTNSYTIVVGAPGTIALGPSTLPNGSQGTPYTDNFVTTGGTGPYTYSSTGSIPPGLTLNPGTGALSGTPTAPGTYSFTVTTTDANGLKDSHNYTVTIGATGNVVLGPSTAPNGTQNTPYTQTFTTTGGTGPYTYSSGGSLPPGTTLDPSTGILSGAPTSPGTYTFTVTTTDANGKTATNTYTVTIGAADAVVLGPQSIPNGTQNTPYTQSFSSTGGNGPYAYTSTIGSLPPGLTLDPNTGVLSGTPTSSGTFTFAITTTDANGLKDTKTYTAITFAPAASVALGPNSLSDGTQSSPYSQTFVTTGGAGPYTYGKVSGTLPAGMTLNANTGVLSGTPTTPGTYSFAIKTTDANGQTATNSYTVTIAATGAVVLGPTSLPNSNQGTAYGQNFTTTGGTGPYTYSQASGSLPPGLTLSSSGGLTGTPTKSGTYTFAIKTTDANGLTDTNTYSLTVGAASSPVLGPVSIPNGTEGSPFSQTFITTGGTGPYTYGSAGNLPPGLTLDPNTGVLSGTPTTPGIYTFTVTSTDANGNKSTNSYTVTIGATGALTLGPGALPNVPLGSAYNQTFTTVGGTGPYSYSQPSGTLPPGVTLNANGVLSGTPTTAGAFTFAIKTTDANGMTATNTYSVTVTGGSFAITTTSLPSPTMGTNYTHTLQTSGGVGPISWAVTTGALPAGLTLNASTGVISGTPTGAGCYNFTITATDANRLTAQRVYNGCISRPNPAADANVRGIISSQARSAYRFVRGQMALIQAHLERLHDDDDEDQCDDVRNSNAPAVVRDFCITFNNGIQMSTADRPQSQQDRMVQDLKRMNDPLSQTNGGVNNMNRTAAMQQQQNNASASNNQTQVATYSDAAREFMAFAPEKAGGSKSILYAKQNNKLASTASDGYAVAPRIKPNSTKINIWTAGQVEFGRYDNQGRLLNEKFNVGGVATGIDMRVTPKLKVGVSFGYGNDYANINYGNAFSQATNFSGALYGSYKIMPGVFLDGTAGYGNLNYNTGRLAADGMSWMSGNRGGYAFFEALYLTAEQRYGAFKIAPYLGVAGAQIQLGQYAEMGNYNWALSYLAARTGTVDAIGGLRASYDYQLKNGMTLTPNVRTQFQKFFTGSVSQFMSYTQDPTLGYNYTDFGQLQWLFMATAGMQVTGKDGIQAGVDFITSTAGARYQTNGVRANIKVPF